MCQGIWFARTFISFVTVTGAGRAMQEGQQVVDKKNGTAKGYGQESLASEAS